MNRISITPILIRYKLLTEAILILILILLLTVSGCKSSPKKPKFTIAASIYVGWMPWFLAAKNGVLKAKADESNIQVDFVRGNYIETITQFAAGGVDAVVLTNIDAYSLLHKSGIESNVILIGSYSNGNDALLAHKNKGEFHLENKTIGLVENSVSHYLLDRLLERRAISFDSVKVINITDSEMAASFSTTKSKLDGLVTWNPIVLQIEKSFNALRVADSKEISYEIADVLMVNRKTLEKHPEFADVLLSTWFSIMDNLQGERRDKTLSKLALLSGGTKEEYIAQLKTTKLIDTPEKALKVLNSKRNSEVMHHVSNFAVRHKLINSKERDNIVSFSKENKKEIYFSADALKRYLAKRK